MKKSLILCKVVIILVTIEFFGCDTYRTTLPELTALPRHSIVVDPPVLVALFDGRSDAQNSEEITMTLRKDLKQIYGQSIEFTDYFVKIPENRILVRIRIQELGANFGSRIVSNVSVTNSLNNAKIHATNGWNSIIVSASSNQSLLGSTISTEGWWIGTAWIELNIVDTRKEKIINFSIPIIAESKESNLWGYKSAEKAANKSWNNVGTQLLNIFDQIILTVRDNG